MKQSDLSLAEWHEVAAHLRAAYRSVKCAIEVVRPHSTKNDRAYKALWRLAEAVGTTLRGPCEDRYFREHKLEQCGCMTVEERPCRHEVGSV